MIKGGTWREIERKNVSSMTVNFTILKKERNSLQKESKREKLVCKERFTEIRVRKKEMIFL